MLDIAFTYEACVKNSERVAWKLDDVLSVDTRLDFSRPFLPDALVGASRVACLSEAERLTLNHVAGNAYLNLFQFVEEYILSMAVEHAQAELFGDHHAIRALVRFAEEEVKHQQLFWRFRKAFDRDIGKPCGVIGAAAEVAGIILSKSPIAVMMTTCHLELMTLQHYTECVKEDSTIDPLFEKLLKFHWLEESQHARIDALELDKYAKVATPETIETAFADYLGILSAFDGLLGAQADLDVASMNSLLGRQLSAADAAEVRSAQHNGYRRTFLWYGMTNPTFVGYLRQLSSSGAAQVAARAAELG